VEVGLVLLASTPTEPDPHYGWIETGEILGRVATEPVFEVESFREQPGAEVARELFAGGHLVNTFILVATASALAETGRRLLPVLSEWFQRVVPFASTEDSGLAIAEAYARAPAVDFSRGILEACPPSLAAARLPAGVTWSDWGTPSRVIRSLRNAGLVPRWLPGVEVDRVDPGTETRVLS
jgi:mannose-1-phosphate guanylyltransferase